MKLKLTIDGKVYEVDVEATEPEAPRPGYIPAAGSVRVPAAPTPAAPPSPGGAPSDEGPVDEKKVCRSPVSGVVVKVHAQPGQAIQPGDVLIIVEAMKMETSITSPVAGKIAAVKAAVGDAVQGGQVLVTFE